MWSKKLDVLDLRREPCGREGQLDFSFRPEAANVLWVYFLQHPLHSPHILIKTILKICKKAKHLKTDFSCSWMSGCLSGTSGWSREMARWPMDYWIALGMVDLIVKCQDDLQKDWMTCWTTCWMTCWMTCRMTGWMTCGMTCWKTCWMTCWMTCLMACWMTGWMSCWLNWWRTCQMNCWMTCWMTDPAQDKEHYCRLAAIFSKQCSIYNKIEYYFIFCMKPPFYCNEYFKT